MSKLINKDLWAKAKALAGTPKTWSELTKKQIESAKRIKAKGKRIRTFVTAGHPE